MDVLLYWRIQYSTVLRTIMSSNNRASDTLGFWGNEAGTLWEKHGIKNKMQDEEL